MKNRVSILVLLTIYFLLFFSIAASSDSYKSKYAGQELREIKSLSEADIKELKNGKGWGLAKAAELNGVPGPIHLLEMQKEIKLTSKQIQRIEAIFQEMKQKAIKSGVKLIDLERELNRHFANKTITDQLLFDLLDKISKTYKELRYIHLSAHLETPNILTSDQILLYNKLRGYSLRGYSMDDPCNNIPKGHNPATWKKHHNCPK